MSKRYGRKQRRKHREQISGLTEELRLARADCDQWRLRADVALSHAAQLEDRAFQRFMRASGCLHFIMDRLATEIGHAAGEQLIKAFASVAPPRHEGFTVKCHHDGVLHLKVRTIELTLPALRVRYSLTDRDLMNAE